jgi:outer membrane protein TolC
MRSLVLTACLVVSCAGPALAQERPAEPLTLIDALQEAMLRNPELVALRAQYDVMRAAPGEARHLAAPTFEAQIWGWPVTTLNPARTDMYMATIEQELPGRGKRAARTLVAVRDAEVTRREITVRANEILDEVRQAYAALARARQTLVIYERQVPVIRDLAEAARLRYASGHGEQHDTVMPLVELTRLQADAIAVRAAARSAEAGLNAVMGRPVTGPIAPLMPMVVTVTPFNPVAAALERHPAIALAAAEIQREQAELARLEAERRPDFVVGGGYMLTPGDAGAWTARAGLTWPNAPWSRGRLDAVIETQTRRVTAASARRDAVAQTIRRAVQEAQVRIDAARERAALIETTLLPHVDHAFDVSHAAYRAGRGPFSGVVEAQRAVLAVQVEAVAAELEVGLALADLDRAIGSAREEPAATEELP